MKDGGKGCGSISTAIVYLRWRRKGFSKGTLHYLKKNAEGNRPFTINKHVRERLEEWADRG